MPQKPLFFTSLQGVNGYLLVVTTRQSLYDWLDGYAQRKGIEHYRYYSPEEDAVVVIPRLDRFSEPGSLQRFVDGLKPKLLLLELYRFNVSVDEFAHPVTSATFDEFFDTSLRESVVLLSDLDGLNNGS